MLLYHFNVQSYVLHDFHWIKAETDPAKIHIVKVILWHCFYKKSYERRFDRSVTLSWSYLPFIVNANLSLAKKPITLRLHGQIVYALIANVYK